VSRVAFEFDAPVAVAGRAGEDFSGEIRRGELALVRVQRSGLLLQEKHDVGHGIVSRQRHQQLLVADQAEAVDRGVGVEEFGQALAHLDVL